MRGGVTHKYTLKYPLGKLAYGRFPHFNQKGGQPAALIVLHKSLWILSDQALKIFIGCETAQAPVSAEVRRHGGNVQFHGPLPVGIH